MKEWQLQETVTGGNGVDTDGDHYREHLGFPTHVGATMAFLYCFPKQLGKAGLESL